MQRRGYSLPLVMLVLTTLGLGLVSLTTVVADGAKTSGSLAGRRRTLYACDGVARALAISAGEYFKFTPTPVTADLRKAICGTRTGPTCPTAASWVPGFTLDAVEVATGEVNVLREVPNGPFAGQTAQRTDLAITVAMTSDSGRACRVTQSMVNGQIGLFQFAVFSGVPIDLFNPPPMVLTGRTHINGDFCAGGRGRGLSIERLTSSGTVTSGCFGGAKALVPLGSISTDGFFAIDKVTRTPKLLSTANDHASPTWRQDALATWGSNVQDSAHDVPMLRLPVSMATSAQPGNNQDGVAMTNLDTLRVMVDPPQAGDTAASAAERLFNKADIRIVNGVWYLRDGTVMWSDHTGSVPRIAEEVALGTPATIGAPPVEPVRFSYYERSGESVDNDGTAPSVVSYGTLFRVSANEWRPGVATSATNVREATSDTDRVDGTRSGFIDRRVALQSTEVEARILPLNFDVGAFTKAMTTTTPKELGSYFDGGARFNGIVWIGNSWPDHDRGFTSSTSSNTFAATAPSLPFDGSTTPGLYASPPLPLCRRNAGGPPLVGAIPQVACDNVALARVNAVRVINAEKIDPDVFPRGLSIATNGPLYTLGNVNTASLTGGVPGTPRIDSPTGNWVPLMLAGDALTVLSTNWTDRTDNALGVDRTWGTSPRQVLACPVPDAGATTIVAGVVAGHVDTATTWGGGINNFPRFVECWTGVPHRMIGSLVIGFRSVYQRQRFHLFSYRPPNRLWSFDPNFESPAHQPPGTPHFFVQAVERWRRD
jgi:hypothetical protein